MTTLDWIMGGIGAALWLLVFAAIIWLAYKCDGKVIEITREP